MRIVAGKHKNRKILAPSGQTTRPSSERLRETLFNLLQMQIEDTDFLDLFAGSGAVGIESLSRGAKRAVFVENDRHAAHAIEKNLEQLQEEDHAQILQGDVFKVMDEMIRMGKEFDIIFADPPYYLKEGEIPSGDYLLQLVDQSSLLRTGGMLFIEDASNYTPNMEGIVHLTQKKPRKMGRSTLHQFVKSQI